MLFRSLENIVKNLIQNGKAKDTPVALIRWGTTPKQQTITGTLENIVQRVREAKLKAPAIIIIGHVVSLREELAWFDARPLFGKRIIITRARAQASALVQKLSDLGADCIEIPTIEISPPKDITPLQNSIENIKQYDWLILTSVNGVKFFFDTLFGMGKDVRILGHLKFACIGPVTKERLRDYGIVSDILPETYRAESVVKAFSDMDMPDINMKDKKVLLPRAKKARTILPDELEKMGAQVDAITAYETLLNEDGKKELIDRLRKREIDAVTFTSSSTVSNFMSLIDPAEAKSLMNGVLVASIGPITSDTARELGLEPDIEAEEYTIPGLVDALLSHYLTD